MKNVKRVVTHPKLFLAKDGKLTHVPAGTEIVVSEAQLNANLLAKTAGPDDKPLVDVSAQVDAKAEKAEADAKAALARAEKAEADAKALLARAEKAEKALVSSASKPASK